MAKRRENMLPLNSWQPRGLVEQIDESRKDGEDRTAFVRAAVVRELRRRGIKAQVPDVGRGRPVGGRHMTDDELNAWAEAGLTDRRKIGELDRMGIAPAEAAEVYPTPELFAGTWGEGYQAGMISDLEFHDYFFGGTLGNQKGK